MKNKIIKLLGILLAIGVFLVMFYMIFIMPFYMSYQKKQRENMPGYKEAHTYTYEVCSCYQYVQNKTNAHGGILRSDQYCHFSYIDQNSLKERQVLFSDIQIGEKDVFIIYDYGKKDEILYLTKETLQKLNNY